MSRVAIVTDSASDLSPGAGRRAGDRRRAPPRVASATRSSRPASSSSAEAFWARMTAPDAPFPKTAAASPVAFRDAFEAAFAAGADVGRLHQRRRPACRARSSRRPSAREMLPEREIHVDRLRHGGLRDGPPGDARPGSGRRPAARAPRSPPRSAERSTDVEAIVVPRHARVPPPGRPDQRRPGGRSGRSSASSRSSPSATARSRRSTRSGPGARPASGRSSSSRRARSSAWPSSTASAPTSTSSATAVIARAGQLDPAPTVETAVIGPSIGPHLGPGALGAAMLYRRA